MFKFKKEIGWSEIIAFGALVVSTVALWQVSQSSEGHIIPGGGIVTTGIVNDEECLFIAKIPIEFHNSGKTAVSLDRYTPGNIDTVVFLKNNTVLNRDDVKYEMYLTNQPIGPYLPLWVKLVRQSLPFDADSYAHIGSLIYPNSSYASNLVLLAKNNINGKSISDGVGISFNAEFSNGQTLPVNSHIQVTQVQGDKCRS